MKVEDIGVLLGDRVLVEKLGSPKKVGQFYRPDNYVKKEGRSEIWWGKIVKFGLDSRVSDGYSLKEGDIVGVDPIALDCTTISEGDKKFVWVPDEFIAIKDQGSVEELYANS